ncbi:2-oxoacid:acceptor oxidoreductase, alpha subunit [Caldisphaera lagunensis DSM 15908]|uniref:2-oxoacid oxidoreductase (ferredoxin) n=1 Tax=Caldisphaera lagunensis (strain DSM 15908 / JCM 11604 / ANMR 0165 / IC-154) TaxID=1056495 RepID=L0A9M8_CALLD|nr:2-oxoacid:ferredoxin oxidoreductase subunit alpha [Caldisphaera lagunensis]AFZ70104.1 2-oxoacid:acceptor oxidoreductase, alpha subunit [Caldisphaera lagunensis DSM 15908]
MPRKEIYFILGGPQGAGLETSSSVLTSAFTSEGYAVLSDREYYSNIIGRHSYIHATVSSIKIPRSLTYPVDIVGGMDAETIFTHFNDLSEDGFIIYDSGVENTKMQQVISMEKEVYDRISQYFKKNNINQDIKSLIGHIENNSKVVPIKLDYRNILNSLRDKYSINSVEAQKYKSSILIGAVAGLADIDSESISTGIEQRFKGKQKIIEANNYIAETVKEMIQKQYGSPLKLDHSLINMDEFIVASGNDIVGMGKIVGGVRYQSYYPITPAADESVFLEAHQAINVNGKPISSIAVFQTEDEIAAITSAIGAGLAGVRSATATSGPGYSLMVEGLGWAGHNEVPLVITYYQRGGPSTGLPTRGSQSDLLFSLYSSHGEFPRIVLASGDNMEAFYDSIEAFNYAEKYQLPVIHLLDKFLANVISTTPLPDLNQIKLDRGKLTFNPKTKGAYKRFDLSEVINERPALGSGVVMWHTGDEHNEYGHISEDPENRKAMYEKRMKKLEIADKEIPPEKRAVLYGDENADFLLIGWGFVKGVALDALDELRAHGLNGAYLHLKMFIPFPSKYVKGILDKFDNNKIIDVEHNILGQAAQAITTNTGYIINKFILKYTGRPIYRMELVKAIRNILDNKSDKEVLVYGE